MSEFVRIYNGHDADSTIVGFSLGIWDIPKQPAFWEYMVERGYRWRWIDHRPEGTVSLDHIEIRPPLSAQAIQEFGALVVGGGFIDDEYQFGLVPHAFPPLAVCVTDNREQLPATCFDESGLFAANETYHLNEEVMYVS
jgi:hypothetical protein